MESGIIITDMSNHLSSICLLKQTKHVCGKLNDRTSCIDHIKINNITSYNPFAISNAFAEHFTLIGKNLAIKIPSPKKEPT